MGMELVVHECGCAACRAGDHADRDDHRQLNLLLSRLDEQQRRWVAGREAKRLGHGGLKLLAEITGLHPETIRRGGDELDEELRERLRFRRPMLYPIELGVRLDQQHAPTDERWFTCINTGRTRPNLTLRNWATR